MLDIMPGSIPSGQIIPAGRIPFFCRRTRKRVWIQHKKIVSIVLALCLCLSLCACGKSKAAKADEEAITAIGEVTLASGEAIGWVPR